MDFADCGEMWQEYVETWGTLAKQMQRLILSDNNQQRQINFLANYFEATRKQFERVLPSMNGANLGKY